MTRARAPRRPTSGCRSAGDEITVDSELVDGATAAAGAIRMSPPRTGSKLPVILGGGGLLVLLGGGAVLPAGRRRTTSFA